MTIDELYQYVQFAANKEQRGYVKPSEFNMLATRAQIDVIQDRYGKHTRGGQVANSKKQTHSVLDDIEGAVTTATLTYSASTNRWSYPTDFLHFMTLVHNENSVDLSTQDQLRNKLSSSLLPPTINNPIAVMDKNGFDIYTSPSTSGIQTGTVKLTYIQVPTAPNWGFQLVNNIYVHDGSSSNTVQLSLGESTHMEIANRILGYIGINLREADLTNYSTQNTKNE